MPSVVLRRHRRHQLLTRLAALEASQLETSSRNMPLFVKACTRPRERSRPTPLPNRAPTDRRGASRKRRALGLQAVDPVSSTKTQAAAPRLTVGLVVLRNDARFVFDGLTGDALPVVILSLVCGTAVLILLRRGARRGARPLAAGAVGSVIWAWGRRAASVSVAAEAHHRRCCSSERDSD